MEHRLNSPAVVVRPVPGPGLVGRIVARLAAAWSDWRRERDRERLRRSLDGLNDATLRDLGLTRGELGSVAAEIVGAAAPTRRRTAVREPGAKP